MSSSSRAYNPPAYPNSATSPTTASSLGYSQYGSTPFASSSRTAGGGAAGLYSTSVAPPARPPLIGERSRNVSSASVLSSGSAAQQGGGGGGGGGGSKRQESKEVARVHWRALREFLASWLKDESPSARASAREKLTRLTKLQFQELSTDVYDELMRRLTAENGSPEDSIPFLPVRDDFHPKRNQARQKLATLPRNRFKDLASDVFFELKRRYPEFEEEEARRDSGYGAANLRSDRDGRAQPRPIGPPGGGAPAPAPGGTGSSSMQRAGSGASAQSAHVRSGSRNFSDSSLGTNRSAGGAGGVGANRDLRDRLQRGEFGSGGDRGDEMEHLDGFDDRDRAGSVSRNRDRERTAAQNEVVVPNKSRMREEDIEVPYARDSVLDTGGTMSASGSRTTSRPGSRASMNNAQGQRDSRLSVRTTESMRGQQTAQPQPTQRGADPRATPDRPIQTDVASPNPTNDDREYYDRMSFSSNVTNKSKMVNGGNNFGWDEDRESKLRSEYEFRIATLERRLGQLETERDDLRRREEGERTRRTEWEDERRGFKERATTHASQLRSLQHEVDLARDAAENARRQADQNLRTAEEEITQWRERCDGLEEELRRLDEHKLALEAKVAGAAATASSQDDSTVAELKGEMQNLLDELNGLAARNDELVSEREADVARLSDMEAQIDDWKRKYQQAKLELRNMKATSTMFVSKPVTDDHLPASPDGNIKDVNVSAFQTGIDTLLTAARSSAPSGVLPAMKAIVEAITDIGEDVKAFEAQPNLDVDVNRLESLKHDSTARLSGLMTAARNHAMASGLSPVSLLDAAAGHLSANVVEIIKLLKIRRTVSRRRSSLSIKEMVERDAGRANAAYDREYGRSPVPTPTGTTPASQLPERSQSRSALAQQQQQEERLRDSPSPTARKALEPISATSVQTGGSASSPLARNGSLSPVDRLHAVSPLSITGGGGGARQSDAFELDRRPSVASSADKYNSFRPVVESRSGYRDERERVPSAAGSYRPSPVPTPASTGNTPTLYEPERQTPAPPAAPSPGPAPAPRQADSGFIFGPDDEGGDEGEWDELKPYLNTQSSALVNSIQNLLAAIRTGSPSSSPALNEHLSEVIAIASSIVAVAGNALPHALRAEGGGLLRDLVTNTDRLSEAQAQAQAGGGVFEKPLRQGIASASFGVAKALKSLMKLGVE